MVNGLRYHYYTFNGLRYGCEGVENVVSFFKKGAS